MSKLTDKHPGPWNITYGDDTEDDTTVKFCSVTDAEEKHILSANFGVDMMMDSEIFDAFLSLPRITSYIADLEKRCEVTTQSTEDMRASSQHYRLYAEELEKTAKQAEDYIDKYRALKDACINLVIERDELRQIVKEQRADLEAYRRAYPDASEWDGE